MCIVYYSNHVLELTDSIDDVGAVRWQLVLCYLLSWAVIVLCLVKGIKSVGKVRTLSYVMCAMKVSIVSRVCKSSLVIRMDQENSLLTHSAPLKALHECSANLGCLKGTL